MHDYKNSLLDILMKIRLVLPNRTISTLSYCTAVALSSSTYELDASMMNHLHVDLYVERIQAVFKFSLTVINTQSPEISLASR